MDIFTPKAMIVAAVIAVASATSNIGMFTWVNGNVEQNTRTLAKQNTATAVHAEQIKDLKEDQKEIKKYTKEVYDWVLTQRGKEAGKNDTR